MNLMLPGNPRYQPKSLQPFFGYDNLYRGVADVEIATLETLMELGIIPQEVWQSVDPQVFVRLRTIPTSLVDERERITKHDIRAWVQLAQEIINDTELKRWVHIPLTSFDALDTGRILQYQRAYIQALRPKIAEVVTLLAAMVRQYADQLQIGRTHGQHALPITVGFWLATIINRIVYNWEKMDEANSQLVGKISGAVGAHNAQVGLGISKLAEKGIIGDFESRVLAKLDLNPAPISTQILPPEPLAYFLFSSGLLSASLAQFGLDCRQLMRSEISEVAESFGTEQVGSSTMAHKRNPINFENLQAMWLKTKGELNKVLDTLLSEHQRDLVGSAVTRDFPIILVNLMQQLDTLCRKNDKGVPFLTRITIDPAACQRNFSQSAHLILAEPLYIALQMAGFSGDAHELVNHTVVPAAQKSGRLLIEELAELAQTNDELGVVFNNIPQEIMELLHHPESYIGDASERALEIAEEAEGLAREILAA